jgi:chromosome partitioning protein
MRVLAVINQKGGAGKTTLANHVGEAAVENGKRTLFVDLDPQGSLSLSHPPLDGAISSVTASMLFSSETSELQPERLSDSLAIIRADKVLSRLGGNVAGAEKRVAANLQRFAKEYDLCVIDTPGAIGFNPPMTVAALVAADAVICPFSVGLYEGRALADLWDYLKVIKGPAYNPRLRLMGLLPSKINTRSREEVAALADLRKQFGSIIVPGMLAERAAVKKAVMNRKPVWKNTKGAGHLAAAHEWRSVCAYILGNLGGTAK